MIGGSGTLNFMEAGTSIGSFLGFQDSAGISSITIEDFGDPGTSAGAYSFDNLTTAIPEPSSYVFAATACLAIAYRRRRKVHGR